MNERIRELARQAWDYAEENNPEPYRDMYDLCLEKFAELIIRECVQLCVNRVNSHVPEGSFRDGARGCLKDISYHFGVEE